MLCIREYRLPPPPPHVVHLNTIYNFESHLQAPESSRMNTTNQIQGMNNYISTTSQIKTCVCAFLTSAKWSLNSQVLHTWELLLLLLCTCVCDGEIWDGCMFWSNNNEVHFAGTLHIYCEWTHPMACRVSVACVISLPIKPIPLY